MTIRDAEFYERFVEVEYGSDCHGELQMALISRQCQAILGACETVADLVQVLKDRNCFGHIDSIVYQLLKGNDESKGETS